MTYDWMAGITYFVAMVALTKLFTWAAFQVPAFAEQRELNRAVDKQKLSRSRFKDAVRVNMRAGMYLNFAFYFLVLPFCVSLDPRPLWRSAVDVVAILLVFDFMYYWTHRLLFHGKILRKVHSLHHQARKPTFIDSQYVHPIETVIGLGLFLISIPIVAWAGGAPVNAFAAVIATLGFTQLNTLNHVFTDLPKQPYKVVNYITGVHAAHHVDMNQGNFATLTMFYDWLFGTYEKPVHRSSAG
jgi:sterol desaturase/sphingolipid hydroxylase (fatty acid hydroxylase superfamily)